MRGLALHCMTWRGVCTMSLQPKDGWHFLFRNFHLREPAEGSLKNFGGKLHTVLRLLCDSKKDFWKTELLPNSRIFVTVFLVPCISRLRSAFVQQHNVQVRGIVVQSLEMRGAISAMQCPAFNSSWLQQRQQIVIRVYGEEEARAPFYDLWNP